VYIYIYFFFGDIRERFINDNNKEGFIIKKSTWSCFHVSTHRLGRSQKHRQTGTSSENVRERERGREGVKQTDP